MSDFLTRLVQRQQGSIHVVQPRIPPMFAPVRSGDVPLSGAIASQLPSLVREEKSALTTQRPSMPPPAREHPQPGRVSDFVPMVDPSTEASRQVSRNVNVPTEWSLGTEGPVSLSRPAPETRSLQKPAQTGKPKTKGSSLASVMEGRQSGRATREAPPHFWHMEAPPRLVTQQVEPEVERISAPTSLLSAEGWKRPSDNSAQDRDEPPVQVTIGRIEVTAATLPSQSKRKAAARPASMSLQDYLTRRQGGRP